MELVKAKVAVPFFLLFFLASGLAAGAQEYSWKTYPMDGSRVGAALPGVDNVQETLGSVRNGVYTAPNGKKFRGSTARVAELMIAAQPAMAEVKEYVGTCPGGMPRGRAAIGNMIVDSMMEAAAEATGLPVDIGLTNYGGIRVDMPDGDVIMDDIISMLPFKNMLVVVTLKGTDVIKLFEKMAAGRVQVVGGVEVTVRDRKLAGLKVGGKPVEADRLYNLATSDFLLTGGDGIFAALNAVSLQMTDELLREGFLRRLLKLREEGKPITYDDTPRVKYLDREGGK